MVSRRRTISLTKHSLIFLYIYGLLGLCFLTREQQVWLGDDGLAAVDGGPDRIGDSCDHETQNGKAAISVSLPFEFVTLSVRVNSRT